jgi:hypothetical protein
VEPEIRRLAADILFGFNNFFCAMIEYAKQAQVHDFFRKSNKWLKLSKACELEQIVMDETLHRAKADAMLTHLLTAKILNDLRK